LTLAHFHQDRYEAAADAAHKAVHSNPAFSFSYMLLAAPLAKLLQCGTRSASPVLFEEAPEHP
jgi:hypothetical protein